MKSLTGVADLARCSRCREGALIHGRFMEEVRDEELDKNQSTPSGILDWSV